MSLTCGPGLSAKPLASLLARFVPERSQVHEWEPPEYPQVSARKPWPGGQRLPQSSRRATRSPRTPSYPPALLPFGQELDRAAHAIPSDLCAQIERGRTSGNASHDLSYQNSWMLEGRIDRVPTRSPFIQTTRRFVFDFRSMITNSAVDEKYR